MTIPTGRGEVRGPESADLPGNPLPSRPARAKANDASAVHGITPSNDRAHLGLVDMKAGKK